MQRRSCLRARSFLLLYVRRVWFKSRSRWLTAAVSPSVDHSFTGAVKTEAFLVYLQPWLVLYHQTLLLSARRSWPLDGKCLGTLRSMLYVLQLASHGLQHFTIFKWDTFPSGLLVIDTVVNKWEMLKFIECNFLFRFYSLYRCWVLKAASRTIPLFLSGVLIWSSLGHTRSVYHTEDPEPACRIVRHSKVRLFCHLEIFVYCVIKVFSLPRRNVLCQWSVSDTMDEIRWGKFSGS